MEPFADRADRALTRHPAPALQLTEVERLARGSVPFRESYALAVLRSEPTRFRILDPWQGAWRVVHRVRRRSRRGWQAGEVRRDLWVVPRPSPQSWRPAGPQRLTERLRSSLVRLGWTVDDRSAIELARWWRLVHGGIDTRERLMRPH